MKPQGDAGMIAVVKPGANEQQIDNLLSWFHSRELKTHVSRGEFQTIIGLIGDTSQVDIDLLEGLDIVESVKRISEPFKRANRKFHPADTAVDIGGLKIGGGHFQVIAGPCSVESSEQILCIAESVKASGASMLRGGVFKRRTSPYAFQGLRAEGIELLLEAKARTGMPVVTEIMNADHLPLFEQVDVIQVGARNMQNFELLKELSHLPVIVDPSHAVGVSRYVKPMAMAAAAAGADGLIIEVHNDPPNAVCDGAQSLTPEQFADLSEKIRRIREAAL
jgi:3-deoxy-7-phosphoheptulonate synthase